jgi:hypothetical protein
MLVSQFSSILALLRLQRSIAVFPVGFARSTWAGLHGWRSDLTKLLNLRLPAGLEKYRTLQHDFRHWNIQAPVKPLPSEKHGLLVQPSQFRLVEPQQYNPSFNVLYVRTQVRPFEPLMHGLAAGLGLPRWRAVATLNGFAVRHRMGAAPLPTRAPACKQPALTSHELTRSSLLLHACFQPTEAQLLSLAGGAAAAANVGGGSRAAQAYLPAGHPRDLAAQQVQVLAVSLGIHTAQRCMGEFRFLL